MKASEYLDLSVENRSNSLKYTFEKIEHYFGQLHELKTANPAARAEILEYLSVIDFNKTFSPEKAIDFITRGLDQFQVHTPHPSYYGLFNPSASAMGVIADALVAAYNPQLAAWSHSPLPNEIENLLINEFGKIFFGKDGADGTFTSGGAEANHTALIAALTHHFPSFQDAGLQAISDKPVFYVSEESHHSFLKAARFCGLGKESVRIIGVDESFRMISTELEKQINSDRSNGHSPFMIVGTIGTTSCGAIDPLNELSRIAAKYKLWLHADAAWGGAIGLLPEFTHFIKGLSNADSISFDAHKWLSVPMGAGMFLTSHSEIMHKAFGIETAYMPVKNSDAVTNPFHHSIQWSRRFIGLKLFLSLSVAGWEGYREVIRHMIRMGDYLRDNLKKNGWYIINDSILPVVCFALSENPDMDKMKELETICNKIVNSGKAWISVTILNGKIPVLRACITNYRTEKEDLNKLIDCLKEAL